MRVKNWAKFQHYKRRDPPWIRLYRTLLNDPEWHALDGDHVKALIGIWLIASEGAGELPPLSNLAFRLRASCQQTASNLLALSHWLILENINELKDASSTLASRYQDARPETEKKERTSPRSSSSLRSEEELVEPREAARDDEIDVIDEDPKARLFRLGKTILVSFGIAEKRLGPLLGRWLKHCNNDVVGLLAALEFARDQNVADPVAYISAMLKKRRATNGRQQEGVGDMARRLADEWRRRERERDEGLFREADDAGGTGAGRKDA